MNSKQIVAAVAVIALVIILVYPALSTGTVSILVRSEKLENADHVYLTIDNIWAHRAGRPSQEGWELVLNQSQTIDLVPLVNSTTSLVKDEVSISRYDAIRLEISNVTWVFNKTSTKLQLQLSEFHAELEFVVQGGRESVITLAISGRQQEIGGTGFFLATVKATSS